MAVKDLDMNPHLKTVLESINSPVIYLQCIHWNNEKEVLSRFIAHWRKPPCSESFFIWNSFKNNQSTVYTSYISVQLENIAFIHDFGQNQIKVKHLGFGLRSHFLQNIRSHTFAWIFFSKQIYSSLKNSFWYSYVTLSKNMNSFKSYCSPSLFKDV